MNLKQTVLNSARQLGFQQAVIAGLEPMPEARAELELWLAAGYAAGMEYMRRDPNFRASPALLCPTARSAIIVSVSYYSDPPPDPGPAWGRVARYAVGRDYHFVIRQRLAELAGRIEEATGRPVMRRTYTDDVPLLEQRLAARAGLGFIGRNTLIIGPKLMGSYQVIAELFTDLPLEPDEPYTGTCGKCFRCGSVCPTGAIVEPGQLDSNLCISYLTIENKGAIPLQLREKIGSWVFGCDLCQEVCPYNQRPPETPWQEFRPESGVGHYLELTALLKIATQAEFKEQFAHTSLTRPKRRGLLRNVLVVIGNRLPPDGIDALIRFAESESDLMLKEHAAWALARYDTYRARQAAEAIYRSLKAGESKGMIAAYMP